MFLSIEVILILKKVGIFSQLTHNQLIELANAVEEIEVPAGNTIFQEQEVGGDLFIIAHGKVHLNSNSKEFGYLGSYDLLGELSVLDNKPRWGTATAVEDVLLFRIQSEVIYDLMEEDINLVKAIMKHLCTKIRNYRDKVPIFNKDDSNVS